MTYLLSKPVEKLIQDRSCDEFKEQCDVLIVGSGYGGAIAAMRLAGLKREDEEKPISVYVFERGNEYATGDFPESLGEIPGHVQFLRNDRDLPIGYADALFDFRIDNPVSVLVGCGLGGGSLINANVAMEPDDNVFRDPAWPAALRDKGELEEPFREVRKLLGVRDADVKNVRKFAALEHLAKSLGVDCKPAPVSVTQQDGPNAVGIEQKACIKCANCVTGCNVGAKNTLPMNALPLARSRGARLYTGATVLSVEPSGADDGSEGWTVRFRRTATSKTLLCQEVFTLHAKVVILAAGTLGSTEILLRSQVRCPDRLKFSERLGARFSTNGDVLAFGYAQQYEVNAVAHPDVDADESDAVRSDRRIGPTITGYFKSETIPDDPAAAGRRRQVTIEDGAVPSALTHVFGEIVATASLPRRYVNESWPAWFNEPHNEDKDPLAVHPGALRHSQVLLAMADDRAGWALKLRHSENDKEMRDHDFAMVRVCSEPEPRRRKRDDLTEPSVFQGIDHLLERAKTKGGFDGGDYLPNPLWKLFPDEFKRVSKIPTPGGNLLSVHPLGGCAMGDDRDHGVVDHYGRVFKGGVVANRSVYDGLYVMDGAIIPCALGVNPFLTIGALAYRNSAHVGELLNRNAQGIGQIAEGPENLQMIIGRENQPHDGLTPVVAHKVAAIFSERMMGRLHVEEVPDWLLASFGEEKRDKVAQLANERGLVIEVQVRIEDVLKWLRATNEPLHACAKLFANFAPGDTVADENLRGNEVAAGKGEVKLLYWNRPTGLLDMLKRALLAGVAFSARRTKEFVENLFAGDLRGSWSVTRNHTNWRELRYSFTFRTPTDQVITLEGTKQLAYALGKKDPWTALVDLPIELRDARRNSVEGLLQVDVIRLTRQAPLQIVRSPNTPVAIAAMASAGMMMLRVLFQTHFWSFGAPEYPQQKLVRVPNPGQWPGTERDSGSLRLTNGASIEPQRMPLLVPESSNDPDGKQIELRLTRYQPAKVERNSILLIHGLAHGSLVFTTETTTLSLAAYLYENGYDVWLLDYRLSIALPDRIRGGWLAERQWTMDQIARDDMHAAVKYVYDATGKKPVQVFAHCIGAASIAMAILSGRCHDPEHNRSMISALGTHAVHPWVKASVTNHLKDNLAAFLKDAITWKTLDAVLPDAVHVTALDVFLDRIAGSIPSPSCGEALRHRFGTDKRMGKDICNRMTLFYGYEWKHGNLTCATHKALANLVGIGNLETFRQIYFIVQRRRLTTREGENRYVMDKNFENFWTFPTLFGHGSKNEVYSPVSALGSCLRLRALREQLGTGGAPNYDAYWLEVLDCGHMDFLFGKDAHVKVFPYLDAFFRRAQGVQLSSALETAANRLDETPPPNRDPHWDFFGRPTCGPVMGAVRAEDTVIVLRLWVEPYLFSAIDAPGNTSTPDDFQIVPLPLPAPVMDSWSYPGTYWIYDLSVPREFERDLRVSIDYGNRADVKFKVEPVDLQQAAATLAGDELYDRDGVNIPLAKLPWFKRLRRNERRTGVAFLVGSCRYPGSPFDEDLADSIFKAMLRHVADSEGITGNGRAENIDHVLFVGDQIYADATADVFDTRELRERYARRYREAFGTKYLRRLFASVPTYMALDDHEFDDNWPGNAEDLANRGDKLVDQYTERFKHGLAAAMAYQWSMSPRDGWSNAPAWRPQRDDSGLWYSFESGGLPFFVMDTRTERTLRKASISCEAAQLVGNRQVGALTDWLAKRENGDKPKFIVSGSVLGLVAKNFIEQPWLYRSNDGWAGYPATWRKLVQHIVQNNVQNVVFVGGDYHLSALTQMTLSSGNNGEIVAYQIVSSGLFAPLPFANAKSTDYSWGVRSDMPFSDGGARIKVLPYLLSTNSSHFLRVDVRPTDDSKWSIDVTVCDRNGVIPPEMPVAGPFTTGKDNVIRWTLEPR